jgi:hypothetical protein
MLVTAALLLIFIGLIHSYLGEKYLLIPLFKRNNLPKILGSEWFAKQTLRFAWHLTTVAWFGFAAILFVLDKPKADVRFDMLIIITVVFALSGILSLVFSRGKHLAWIAFLAVAGLSFYSASQV